MNSLETQILRLIGEDPSSPDVFTDDEAGIAPIRDSINDAIQEISMVAGGYTETFTVPLQKGVTFYRINFQRGTFGWVMDAWSLANKRRLTHTSMGRLDAEDPRWMQHDDSPSRFVQVGLDVVGFAPRPSATSGAIELKCAVIPAPYDTDTDWLKVREEFRFAPVHYALSEFYAGRGDAQTAAHHLGVYIEALQENAAMPKGNDTHRRFEDSNGRYR